MKYVVIVLLVLELATEHAFAGAACGPCATGYGCCAERASMADCISCGVCFHGEEKRKTVLLFCHTYWRSHKNPCLMTRPPRWCSLPHI
jgi:hypothetical protein